MIDRSFSELDLRMMLERAKEFRSDVVEGRWVIVTRYNRRTWEIVVEPDAHAERVIVITAYPCWES
jgi:hypothetical protein